jgi:transcriptional regulator with XRE-family HTH domain
MRFKELGRLIKSYREEANLAQKDIAQKLGYSNAQFISNWERGLSCVPDKTVKKLCAVLGMPPTYFGRQLLRIRQREIEKAIGESI